jgi:hypothetical protein
MMSELAKYMGFESTWLAKTSMYNNTQALATKECMSHFTEMRGAQTAQALAKKERLAGVLESQKCATRNNKCACITS